MKKTYKFSSVVHVQARTKKEAIAHLIENNLINEKMQCEALEKVPHNVQVHLIVRK